MENIRVVLFVGGRCPHLPQNVIPAKAGIQ